MISPEILRRYPYFATVSDESLKELAMVAEERSVPAGTELFSEGQPAESLSILVRGEINIEYTLGSGERRVVDTLVAGDLVGWSAVVEPYKMTANGVTTKDIELVCIDAAKLRKLMESDHTLGFQLMTKITKMLAQRVEGARIQLAASL